MQGTILDIRTYIYISQTLYKRYLYRAKLGTFCPPNYNRHLGIEYERNGIAIEKANWIMKLTIPLSVTEDPVRFGPDESSIVCLFIYLFVCCCCCVFFFLGGGISGIRKIHKMTCMIVWDQIDTRQS